ncbi:hypothetical protein GCM10009806_04070 [Microbacterium flavum]
MSRGLGSGGAGGATWGVVIGSAVRGSAVPGSVPAIRGSESRADAHPGLAGAGLRSIEPADGTRDAVDRADARAGGSQRPDGRFRPSGVPKAGRMRTRGSRRRG